MDAQPPIKPSPVDGVAATDKDRSIPDLASLAPSRDAQGRFVSSPEHVAYSRLVGALGGRPPVKAWAEQLDDAVGPTEWRRILRTVLERAEAGDMRAVEFLAEHRHGKAVQRTELVAAIDAHERITVVRDVPRPAPTVVEHPALAPDEARTDGDGSTDAL